MESADIHTGQRVKYVGMFGNADGPIGTVWRVTKSGVWVTFAYGRQQVHPDDIVPAKNA